MFVIRAVAVVLAILSCNNLFAQTVNFEVIPNALSADDMSPDGRFIVGTSVTGPYLYDRQTKTMTNLPAPGLSAVGVSDDGSVVVGDIVDPTGVGSNVAARWTSSTGWVSLGFLPNAGACPSRSDSYEVSADGNVVVGLSFFDGCQAAGFIWTESTGMQPLESLANGVNRASVVSADGTLVGGFAQGSFSRTPAFWGSDLVGELLDPPNGDAIGEVHGMKDDGSIMLGEFLPGDETGTGVATKWTFNGVGWDAETIGNGSILPGWVGIPTDISNDGTIVGFDILLTNRRAWIQYQGQGDLILLKAWANSLGAGIPANQDLQVCQAISADGSVICGHGAFSNAWIVTIEQDCILGDVNLDGQVDLLDVSPFVDLIAAGTFQKEADVNLDGIVNLLDVDGFVQLIGG